MKKVFDFCEIVDYKHAIEIEADSEELLDDIFLSLKEQIDDEVSEKEDLFETIRNMGGSYKFIEDGSPDVEFDY